MGEGSSLITPPFTPNRTRHPSMFVPRCLSGSIGHHFADSGNLTT